MKRYDLRHLGDNFSIRMGEILKSSSHSEVSQFIFEVGDFSPVQRSAELVNALNSTLLNSIRFNRSDWIVTVKKGKV